jgi:hypothetical protein
MSAKNKSVADHIIKGESPLKKDVMKIIDDLADDGSKSKYL